MPTPRLVSALAGVVTALAVGLPASAAAAPDDGPSGANPQIIGGGYVSSAPWAAAVYRSGRFTCSGTIVAARWVLTARHCVGTSLSVRVGNVYRANGTFAGVTTYRASPYGDLALLRLDRSISTSYSPLASSNPPVGSTNYIVGWGMTSRSGPASPRLKYAAVRVTSTNSRDYYGGQAIASTGINGNAWRGDSGGPQFYNGRQVGVASTADGYSRQWYGSVPYNRGWIRSVAGV